VHEKAAKAKSLPNLQTYQGCQPYQPYPPYQLYQASYSNIHGKYPTLVFPNYTNSTTKLIDIHLLLLGVRTAAVIHFDHKCYAASTNISQHAQKVTILLGAAHARR
jgi:hypothetical protein